MATRGSISMQYQTNEVEAEAVSITNAEGLRVDTIISGPGDPVATYFNAKGTKYGLFRLSDGRLLNGALAIKDGRVLGVVSGMMDPDSDGNAYVDVVTSADGGTTSIRLMGVSFDGATDPTPADPGFEPEQTGNIAGVALGFRTGIAWDGSTYLDEVHGFLDALGDFSISTSGMLYLSGGERIGVALEGAIFYYGGQDSVNGTTVLRTDATIRPVTNNKQYLGSKNYRWDTIYSVNALNTGSDERFKRDMAPIERAVEFIMDLNPLVYRYTYDKDDAPLRMGVGALRTEEALSKAGMSGYAVVDRSNPDELSMAYTELIAPLIATVQQQQRLIEEQGRQIEALKTFVGMTDPT